jgi:hypothetical protein
MEATSKDIAGEAVVIAEGASVLLEAIDDRGDKMIAKGMFPELGVLTDDDFKSAEWHDVVHVEG